MDITTAQAQTQPHIDVDPIVSQPGASVFVGMTDVNGEPMAEYALGFAL